MAPQRKRAPSDSRATYQVFLSFRGPDTRQGFTDVLYHALTDAGIHVFRDNNEIREGEQIREEILKAIDDSKILVPIFSRGYVSSKWCLIELAKMVEYSKLEASSGKKKILPIFYDVGVDDVQLKTDLYTGALSEQRKKLSPGEVQQWEEALREAAKIKGYELKDKGHGEFAKSFVKDVSLKLKVKHKLVTEYLVQRDDQVEALVKLLEIESSDVRFVGIHGMGGIGKTTLAVVVFNKLCAHFDHSCFLADVRESSQQKGIEKLQKQLLDSIGFRSGVIMHKDDGITRISKMLAQKKLLLVLDDVDHLKQIQCLAGDDSWFGSGSRIIITTRDRRVLGNGVQSLEVEVMKPEEALRLFSVHAFDKDSPPNDYLSLSKEAVACTGRLPLALEVIGSHLRDKRKKDWVETIKRLEKVPHQEVQEKLMISYKALDHGAKQIFLDIACFFINREKRYPMYMWEACHFDRKMELEVLIRMSLVKIVVKKPKYGMTSKKLWMHDQLRDLGRNIVFDENFKDGLKCSRIWTEEDALEVLKTEEGNENVEMLRLGNIYLYCGYTCTEKELSSLKKLRHLECPGGFFSGDLKHLFPKLTWLSCRDCYQEFKATNLYLRNLVILDLSHNPFVTKDWTGWSQIQVGTKLRVLDLTSCIYLTKTPDLSNYSSLERLILKDCWNLVEIDPSIGKLRGLKFLNLERCKSLTGIPEEICFLYNLEVILGSVPTSVKHLFKMPELIGELTSLSNLELVRFNIIKLPESIGRLSRLRRLSLSHCSWLERLPNSLTDMKSLVKLDLSYTNVVELPHGVGHLVLLEILNLNYCNQMKKLPYSIGDLKSLVELDLSDSGITELPDTIGNLMKLKVIDISSTDIQKLPDSTGMLKSLEKLHARYSSLAEIPSTIEGCICLRVLNLEDSGVQKLPTSIGMLKRLEKLDALGCDSLVEIPSTIVGCTSLRVLCLGRCEMMKLPDAIANLRSLDKLDLSCSGITELPDTIGNLMNLRVIDIEHTYIQKLPTSIGMLKRLEKLDAESCYSLIEIPSTIDGCTSLRVLNLAYCTTMKKLPSAICDLKLLDELDLSYSGIIELPSTIGNIMELRVIDISGTNVQKLPTSIGMLKRLEKLDAEGCRSLKSIPSTIEECACLRVLDLRYSGVWLLPKMPTSLTNLRIPLSLEGTTRVAELKKFGVDVKVYEDSETEVEDDYVMEDDA